MSDLRSALYVDFDNFFSGLLQADPNAALAIAQSPSLWVQRLTRKHVDGGSRRWLQLRCYLNPAGWVMDPSSPGNRLYLSKFRPFFTQAGFQVVDCPALTRNGKNAADIRIVVDVMTALQGTNLLDEFVIASSDSDFTPLLHVIRAEDRRITLIATSDTAVAYEALADRYLSEQDVVDLVNPTLIDVDAEDVEPEDTASHHSEELVAMPAPQPEGLQRRFDELVRDLYERSPDPLNLARISSVIHAQLGPGVKDSNYFGYGSFRNAVRVLQLPHVMFNQHHLWDETRHVPPLATGHQQELPAAIAQFCEVASLPRISRDMWPHVYRLLIDYAATQDFNLTEATRVPRDQALGEGLHLSRQVFTHVVRSCLLHGAPLHEAPVPTAGDVAKAQLSNTLTLADLAGLDYTDSDRAALEAWLHFPDGV